MGARARAKRASWKGAKKLFLLLIVYLIHSWNWKREFREFQDICKGTFINLILTHIISNYIISVLRFLYIFFYTWPICQLKFE